MSPSQQTIAAVTAALARLIARKAQKGGEGLADGAHVNLEGS